MQINDLYQPINLNNTLGNTAGRFLRAPADFSSANGSFANILANPMLFSGGGGTVIDPTQTRDTAGSNFLGQRNSIAGTNLATKASFADILANSGANVAQLQAIMQQLKALQQQSQNQVTNQGLGFLGAL